mmetsp:Transcript_73995/g.207703  ORF Transcript_73995/g.207703 Transcript_73995/m.207703 type:complete len:192 (+) Transcript_73995:55-630(+)
MASPAAADVGKTAACGEDGKAVGRVDSASPAKRIKVEGQSRSDTVKFNVGGRVFEVLREPTLSLHPGTLLSTLADEHSGDDPIFVEANPELFPYILEYLRSRSIHIPLTVSKGAVLAEASRLGLKSLAEGDVKQDVAPLSALMNDVLARHKEIDGMIKDARLHVISTAILSLVLQKFAANHPCHSGATRTR